MKSIAEKSSRWDGTTISLPTSLVNNYRTQLEVMDRLQDAESDSPNGEIGGVTEAETHEHFVHRFGTSAARMSFLALDPRNDFGELARDLHDSFTDGKVSVLDIPCGTGASILGFLGILCSLRNEKLIPRLPLDVFITAGDISQPALELYETMLNAAKVWLQIEGIRIHWQCHIWDVTDPSMTALIVDNWFTQSDSEEWIVFIAAISGFLGSTAEKVNFGKNSRFYQHICERMHDRLGSVTWVEPRSNASKWLLSRTIEILGAPGRWAVRLYADGYAFQWLHPIKERAFDSGLHVLDSKRTTNV